MTHLIMAVNSGSSSLKYELFSMPEEITLAKGLFERLGSGSATFSLRVGDNKHQTTVPITTHQQAADYLLNALLEHGVLPSLTLIDGVGHRVAHGGEYFKDSA